MKKQLILAIALIVLGFSASAQRSLRYWETGLFIGSANYSGELTQGGDIGTTLNEARFQAGLFLKRNFNPKFNLGAEITYGQLYANDANHGNADRGFEMNTSILTTSLTMDLNFKKFGKYFKRNANTPYVTFGFGALVYQPTLKTDVDFSNYDLYPGSNYSTNVMAGFGWKWRSGKRGIFGLSINYNWTGTPYLEGFVEKDSAARNDGYYGLRMFYSLGFFET
ncbi:MAG: DUF6089 family protein [Schleiferiaceae bacterium]|jgi:hypothetical protein|nr:DUF6089 family protein [Schleiferiaceae bacterium]